MSTTPYMGLILPTPTVTAGPAYATQNNTAFGTIDSHDHSTGKGIPIRTAGLAIDADLTMGNYNLTNVRALRMTNNGSALALPADLTCIYAAGGNLYYNNATGQQIQLTAGGALNASSIGGIGGDYATSTASVFYTSSTTLFTFNQNTNNRALMDQGATTIRAAGVSTNGVTIKAPAGLAASYEMTMPPAVPTATAALTMTSAGVMGTVVGGWMPTGVMLDFGGSAAPTGYLLCDGSAVNRTTYAGLFAVIGTTFGVGDGSSTFNVPDFRRRVAVGSGGTSSGTLDNTLGSIGGTETVTLTAAESGLPSHTHTNSVTDPGHVHSQRVGVTGGGDYSVARNSERNSQNTLNEAPTASATTGISVTINGAGPTAASSAHNNLQPSLVVTKIIKT